MNNAPHCKLCGKALYTLRMAVGDNLVQMTVNPDKYHDSDGNGICAMCDVRLIRRGSHILCECGQPVYEFIKDRYKEKPIQFSEIRGISPQHDPIEDTYNRCVHCSSVIWR